MAKICIAISCWKRPETTRMVYKSIRQAEANSDHTVMIAAALSKPKKDCKRCKKGKPCNMCDPTWEQHRVIAEEFEVSCADIPNQPLSDKANARSRFMSQVLWWEYAIVMGSDDMVSPNFFDFYAEPLDRGDLAYGVSDLHFLGEDGQLWYWSGYGKTRKPIDGMSIGAGRLIKREVFERCDWKLWPDGKPCNLDAGSFRIMQRLRIPVPAMPMGNEYAIVDVKDEHSITALDKFDPASLVARDKPEWLRELLGC